MISSNKLQFKSNSGNLYNTTPIPGIITKITVEGNASFTIKVGTASNNINTSATNGSAISGSYSYFKISGGSNTPQTASITVEYTPTHTLTYSATNGSIAGVVYNTSTPVASGASVAEGGKVTLTATPASGYTFSSWEVSGTGSTLSSTSTNPTTFTMGTANATVTANFVAAGNYINVSPTTADITTAAQNVVIEVATDQTLTASSVQFYTAAVGGTTTTKPDWIGTIAYDGSSSPKTLTIPVSENTGVARHAYFSLKNNTVESSRVSINQAAITVETPEFDEDEGTYFEDLLVAITCETNGATIYYTTDGSTPAANNGTAYDGNGVSVVEGETTIKAIAIKNNVSSSVASATYTVMYPLTTMSDIFSAATTANTTPADVAITFNDWAVVYTTSNKAYMTDGQYGLVIYGSSHGFTKEKKYSGTKACKVQLYDGGSELTSLTYSSGTGLTQSDAGDLTPYTVSLATICGENGGKYLGSYVDLGTLTYNSSNSSFSDGTNTIKPYAGGISLPTLENGKTYRVKGVYYIYSNTKQITQYIEGDIAAYTAPAITTSPASSLAAPNYIVSAPENAITYETITVNGTNLQGDITVELENGASSDFVMSTDLETWGNSITLTATNNSVVNEQIAVRLKVGKDIDDYSDRIVLSSTNATTKYVNVTGSVTNAHVTYSGNAEGVTNVPTDNNNYSYNQEVTVLGKGAMARTGYYFIAWDTKDDGTGTTYDGGDKFNITEDITLYAQWDATTWTLTAATVDHGSISFTVGGQAATTAQTGQTVTIVPNPAQGYGMSGFSINGDATQTGTTFTMPAENVTVTAVFAPMVTDALTPSLLNLSGSSYIGWSNIHSNSEAVYAGQSYPNDDAIQLRINNSNSGIITTATGGVVKKVKVIWSGSSGNLYVYGKNAAYASAEDLYTNTSENHGKAGTLLGTIAYTDSNNGAVLEINNDTVTYIGVRSKSGAIYISQIEITWAAPTHTLTYDAHGGSGTMAGADSQYLYNTVVTVLANGYTAPENQMFAKWNDKADGSGKDYAVGDTLKMPRNDKTLYAIWQDACNTTATMAAATATKEYVNTAGTPSFKINLSSAVSALSECSEISEYGFVYSTENTTPTVGGENCTKIVKGNANPTVNEAFTDEIANAPLNTTYYVRSFATNIVGTAYSPAVASVSTGDAYNHYTISYTTNGEDEASTTTIYEGNKISNLIEPTAANIPAGYTFVGWSASAVVLTDEEPTFVENGGSITGDMSLEAVFAIKTEDEQIADNYLTITNKNFTDALGSSYSTETIVKTIGTTNYNIEVNACEQSSLCQMRDNATLSYIYVPTLPGNITNISTTECHNAGDNDYTGTIHIKNKKTRGNVDTDDITKSELSNATSFSINLTGNDKSFYLLTSAGLRIKDLTITYRAETMIVTYSNYCTSVSAIEDDDLPINNDNELTESFTISGVNYLDTYIIVPNGITLTVNGTLGNSDPDFLVIKDGGQLICSNSVAATFKKTMPTPAAPSTKDEPVDVYGWELISSPVHDDNPSTIAVTNVTNLTTSTYDMFAYDEENSQWLNQKNNGGAAGFSSLSNGQGYMYRNNGQELSFVGNTNVETFTKDLTYTPGDLAGFHLVGNPYSESITLMNTTLFSATEQLDTQLSAYYILENNGSAWKTDLAANTPIANKQGFLIQIPSDATKIQFSRTARTVDPGKKNHDNIKFMVANSQFEDVTYALFDKALPLNKIDHRNSEVPMIYINQNNQDYAVATMTDDTKAFNLGFKAGTMGKYTLSYKADGNFDYIHVIDRMTGEDIDMLLEGEYSFIGTPNDNANRFIVKLGYNAGNESSENEIFAYQSGNDIVVNGEGELQVFDVMGRMVMTQRINGIETINVPTNGMYIFRLNEKVQKIVVE
ncbi:MAG: InlB B-repeat-containing protein [Bacteroidales bacterium]|nr:InlB B-repeat-containing protein [Bacteroidales bacterium]